MALQTKRLPAGTGTGGLGIEEMETFAFEAIREVELRTLNVKVAALIHGYTNVAKVRDAVFGLQGGVPTQVVGKPGTATWHHSYAEDVVRHVDRLLLSDLANLVEGTVGDLDIHIEV